MAVDDDEVTDVTRSSLLYYEGQAPTWRQYRAAYRTRFWEDNPFTSGPDPMLAKKDDGLPFKEEANKIWPFVTALVANLFYRNPRTQVELPNVWETEKGRPKNIEELPEIVTGYLDEFLKRVDIRPVTTNAYQLALMYEASALKLGVSDRRKGTILNRMWSQAIPHWEMILDRDADSPETMAYLGHMRWELRDRAAEIVDASLDQFEQHELSDYLDDSLDQPTDARGKKLKKYVRLLEFYDLLAEEQRFYVVEGATADGVVCRPVGRPGPLPYEFPNGDPALPILPVILSNVPDHPCQGLAAVSRVYQLNAEQNMILTVLANAFRREAGRVILYKDGVDDKALSQIMRGRDLEMVKVAITNGSLESLFHVLDLPAVGGSLEKFVAVLQAAWQDTQGVSDLQQGKQGAYLSATEASLLAGFGEATSGDIQLRMAMALGKFSQLALAVTAAHVGTKSLSVRLGSRVAKLTKDIAEMPWAVDIVDSASTPVKNLRKQEAFLQILPRLIELSQLASGTMPSPPGAPPVPVPAAVQKLAQEVLNFMQQKWDLPEGMSWDALAVIAEKQTAQQMQAEEAAKEAQAEQGRALVEQLPARTNAPPALQGG